MAYDSCGTTRLEGDELIRRLANYLGVTETALKDALFRIATNHIATQK